MFCFFHIPKKYTNQVRNKGVKVFNARLDSTENKATFEHVLLHCSGLFVQNDKSRHDRQGKPVV